MLNILIVSTVIGFVDESQRLFYNANIRKKSNGGTNKKRKSTDNFRNCQSIFSIHSFGVISVKALKVRKKDVSLLKPASIYTVEIFLSG